MKEKEKRREEKEEKELTLGKTEKEGTRRLNQKGKKRRDLPVTSTCSQVTCLIIDAEVPSSTYYRILFLMPAKL